MSTFKTNFNLTTPLDPNTVNRGDRVTTLFDISNAATGVPHKVSITSSDMLEVDSSVTITTVVLGVAGQIIDVITDVVPHHVLESDDSTWDAVLYAAVIESQSRLTVDRLAEYLRVEAEHFDIDFDYYVGNDRAAEYKDDIRDGLQALLERLMAGTLQEAFVDLLGDLA